MTLTLTLTPAEEKLILEHRAYLAQKERDQALFLRRLRTAADFAEWLAENGAGITYSTFCNDFGYQPLEDEDRPLTFKIIERLIHTARGGNN